MSGEESNVQKSSNHDTCHKQECEGRILESDTLSKCRSVSMTDFPDYKVPVVISEITVHIDVESKIKLGEPAIEIKRIKKNVFLTECRLIGRTRKLFLKGFIRKNIEYATKSSVNNTSICGDIKHTTVEVPFHCVTEVEFMRTPQIHLNSDNKEITYLNEKSSGRDMKEIDIYSEEFFNEKVYCELLSARIHEADIVEECEKLDYLPNEQVFQTFIEKEVLCLSLKLLQKQQVWAKELISKVEQHIIPSVEPEEIEWLSKVTKPEKL